MDVRLKTLLPLITWLRQQVCGPVLSREVWRAVALSLVPPPDSLTIIILQETTDCDPGRLSSASERQRVRKRFKHWYERHLRNNPDISQVRGHLLTWRQKLEAAGYTEDSSRIRKLREIEAETKDYYASLLESHELAAVLAPISAERAHDAATLLWEFSLYGEGGNRPELTRKSAIWRLLSLNPDQLRGMSVGDGVITMLSRLQALLGLSGELPMEAKLAHLLRWVVRTHLPPEREPETTPEAMNKAVEAGLIWRGFEIEDKDTGEKVVEVEDQTAARFIQAVENEDEFDRIEAKLELSPAERLVLAGLRRGLAGEALVEHIAQQPEGKRLSRASVPVLASRVVAKLKAAAKT